MPPAWLNAKWRTIAAHCSWLTEEWWPWIAVGIAVGVPLVAYLLPGELEPRVRLAGMVLQLCGIGTVAWGIRKTRRFFGEKSYRERVREYWGRRPGDRTSALTGHAMPAEAGDFSIGTGDVGWQITTPEAQPHEKIAALESNVERMRKALRDGEHHLKEEARKRVASIDAERQGRERGDEEVRGVIREAAAGGLDLSAMGVVWLFIGVILGTASPEIAQLFPARWC
jgi:hypothetical protein